MKLLVFSDTHGYPRPMLEVVQATPDVDIVFHLGDGVRDAERLREAFPGVGLYVSQGNCDGAGTGDYPVEGLVDICGLPVYYTHGHMLGVKNDLSRLWIAAKQRGAQVALYGHTHLPHYEFRAGIHLFNPGSISLPRSSSYTYGQILLHEEEAPRFEVMRHGEE